MRGPDFVKSSDVIGVQPCGMLESYLLLVKLKIGVL